MSRKRLGSLHLTDLYPKTGLGLNFSDPKFPSQEGSCTHWAVRTSKGDSTKFLALSLTLKVTAEELVGYWLIPLHWLLLEGPVSTSLCLLFCKHVSPVPTCVSIIHPIHLYRLIHFYASPSDAF